MANKIGRFPFRGFAQSPLSSALTHVYPNSPTAAIAVDVMLEPRAYSLSADAGVFSITGQTAALPASYGNIAWREPGAVAYSAAGGTTVSPEYPPFNAEGDILLLVIGQKPDTANGGTVTTPSGWTLEAAVTAAGGYGTTLGADTGNTNLRIYSRTVPAGGLTGTLAITVGANDVCWAAMQAATSSSGSFATLVVSTGEDATDGATVQVLTLTDPVYAAGDHAVAAFNVPTDAATGFSGYSLTQAGTTFGSANELAYANSPNGNDIGGFVFRTHVTAATGAVYPPDINATAAGTTTNVRGPGATLRLRAAGVGYSLTADAGAFSLTGQAATLDFARTAVADAAAFVVGGQDATFARGFALPADAGAFVLTGQDTGQYHGHMIDAQPGAFTLTGQDATLTKINVYLLDAQPAGVFITGGADTTTVHGHYIDAQPGSFSLTGQSATLATIGAPMIDAQHGAFSLTGQDATLARGVILQAQPAGVFITGGADTTTVHGHYIDAQAASLAITGQSATFLHDKAVVAEAGSFAINLIDADLNRAMQYDLHAEAAAFNISGQDATTAHAYLVDAEAASFVLAGQSASFVRPISLETEVGAFDITGAAAEVVATRMLTASSASFAVSGLSASLARELPGGYPDPSNVRAGVVYGASGEYTGTMRTKKAMFVFDD